MLKGNPLLLQRLQQAAAEADFRVHHRLFHVDDRKILVPRDAGDGVFALVILRLVADHRARLIRVVRVADVRRDARDAHRENGVLMQHACAHIGQLAQLPIGHIADRLRVADDARVSHQAAGNIRPVFIHVRVDRARDNRARDVAAAAGKGFDVAMRVAAVKTRHNGMRMPFQQAAERLLRPAAVQPPFLVEENALLRVDEIPSEIIRQQNAVEVFAPAGGVIRARAELNVAAHLVQIPIQIDRQLQLLRNFAVPRANRIKSLREVAAGRREAVTLIKQIGHLDIGGAAFARRAGHHNAPIRVGKQNLPDLFELRRIGQRTSAKFCNFHTHSEALRFSSFSFSSRRTRKFCNPHLKYEADTILKNVPRKVKSYSPIGAKNAILHKMTLIFSRFSVYLALWHSLPAQRILCACTAPREARTQKGGLLRPPHS